MSKLTVLHRLSESDLWQKPKLMLSRNRLYTAKEVPDYCSGGLEDFELMQNILENAMDGLMVAVKQNLKWGGETR